MERIREMMGADVKTTLHYTYGKINPSCATVRDIEFVNRNLDKVWQEIEMVTSFKHLNFIRPFTCLSGYNSDTITELERKCRRLQTQVFQMEVQWNTVLPPPPPVYTTSLLRQYSFDPNVKTTESFYYFKYPVNATISLLPSGFIVQRWSHQQGSIVVGI